MNDFMLKMLWFFEKGTMKDFPELGEVNQDDIAWAIKEIENSGR